MFPRKHTYFSSSGVTRRYATRLRTPAALLALGLVVFQNSGQAQIVVEDPNPLPYSLSYTITGNYVVATVDFEPTNTDGFQTEVIHMKGASAVPSGATIVAAWLYWETIWGFATEIEGAQLRGQDITLVRGVDQVLTGPFAPCWSNGGDTLTMFRADVLPLLPLELDVDGFPTGRRLVNDADLTLAGLDLTTVTLPEAGKGNKTPQSAGASLLIVYRDPAEPLRRIVVFDGNHIHESGETTRQRIRGFLQSSIGGPGESAQLTYLVASSAPNDTDLLSLDHPTDPTDSFLLATNPFFRVGGGSSDRAWSSSTHDVTSLMSKAIVFDDLTTVDEDEREYGEQFTTTLTHGSNSPYDCLSEAAIIFSTSVEDDEVAGDAVDDDGTNDGDGDGILDILEDASPFGVVSVLKDPNGQAYPDLQAMGAVVGQTDFFVEINSMIAAAGTTYGSAAAPFKSSGPVQETDTVGHNHMPTPAVLKRVGDAQARAGLVAHFDVGDPVSYKALGPAYNSTVADDYIIGAPAARAVATALLRGAGSRSSKPPAIRRKCRGASFRIFRGR